jgi:hypothetical protein
MTKVGVIVIDNRFVIGDIDAHPRRIYRRRVTFGQSTQRR